MKKITFMIFIACLSTFLAVSCGQKQIDLGLGADGYGKATLPNGTRILINQDQTTSLTSARFLVGGGVLSENSSNNGITNLMIKMLLKGNEKMSGTRITEELDFLGASVNADCYRDYSAISFTCLTENFEEVLGIISESFVSPSFPPEELEKLKHEVEGTIKAEDDSQPQTSSKLFWKTIYGDQGYGLPSSGTIASIKEITVGDIKKHFNEYIGGPNLIFSLSTDLEVEEISRIISGKINRIKATAQTAPKPSGTILPDHEGFISVDRNQSFIYMGYALDRLEPEEAVCAILIHEVMGGNVGSRLWSLRQKEKLAYSVYTQYTTDKYSSIFRAGIGTDTSKVKQALNSLNREFDKLVREGLTADELKDARINLKNNLIYRIDRKGARANNMAYYEYIGYNHKFILDLIKMANKIELEEINLFIKNNFREDNKYLSIVGKK